MTLDLKTAMLNQLQESGFCVLIQVPVIFTSPVGCRILRSTERKRSAMGAVLVFNVTGLVVDERAASNLKNCPGVETCKPLANGLVVDGLNSRPEDCEKSIQVSWVFFPPVFHKIIAALCLAFCPSFLTFPLYFLIFSLLAFLNEKVGSCDYLAVCASFSQF